MAGEPFRDTGATEQTDDHKRNALSDDRLYDLVAFANQRSWPIRNPRECDYGQLVFNQPDGTRSVIGGEGVYNVKGYKCTCGNTHKSDIGRGTPWKTAYERRRTGACEHKVAVLNAVDLGPCPECGLFEVREDRQFDERNNWVLSLYTCAICGVDRGFK